MAKKEKTLAAEHPLLVVLGVPAVIIIVALVIAWLFVWREDTPDVRSDGGGAVATTETGNTTDSNTNAEPERANPGWFDRLGIVDGVNVYVNAQEFAASVPVEIAGTNGTNAPIYRLSGCLIPPIEQKQADDTYISLPTASATCASMPECESIDPDTRFSILEWDQQFAYIANNEALQIRESGTYRVPLTYGTGCENGVLSGETTIYSPEFTLK